MSTIFYSLLRMRIPFFQKPKPISTLCRENPKKCPNFKCGERPADFREMPMSKGPDIVHANRRDTPYSRTDIERMRAINTCDESTVLAQSTNLKRRNAKYGDDKWLRILRCNVCDFHSVCPDVAGPARCHNSFYGNRCPGVFYVTERDAQRIRNTPDE
ncbi:hypothetical protein DFH11DRAFT_1573179 [Phellopilus nigrolimitatus]|nr:hypothetical protein DFH11DRAFT_1573179 [Phellopilus nigrolimitatus]